MQSLCSECKKYKPAAEVTMGVCDQCFNYGATRKPAAPPPSPTPPVPDIVLTTSIDVPRREIERVISIVATETALGVNIFRDIANSFRDTFGGRAVSSQNALREARIACLDDLKREAAALGADAVIAIDIDYHEISANGSGGGILVVAASGTAVKLADSQQRATFDT